jgi:hypothetical protein
LRRAKHPSHVSGELMDIPLKERDCCCNGKSAIGGLGCVIVSSPRWLQFIHSCFYAVYGEIQDREGGRLVAGLGVTENVSFALGIVHKLCELAQGCIQVATTSPPAARMTSPVIPAYSSDTWVSLKFVRFEGADPRKEVFQVAKHLYCLTAAGAYRSKLPATLTRRNWKRSVP